MKNSRVNSQHSLNLSTLLSQQSQVILRKAPQLFTTMIFKDHIHTRLLIQQINTTSIKLTIIFFSLRYQTLTLSIFLREYNIQNYKNLSSDLTILSFPFLNCYTCTRVLQATHICNLLMQANTLKYGGQMDTHMKKRPLYTSICLCAQVTIFFYFTSHYFSLLQTVLSPVFLSYWLLLQLRTY